MATPYSVIYASFLSKINDYSFLQLTQNDIDQIMLGWMNDSIAEFYRCKTDLTKRDDTVVQPDNSLGQFNLNLSALEIKIISSLMVVEYLKPRVVDTQTMKQMLSDSDFKMYSQANQIEVLLKLYAKMQSDVETTMMRYTYFTGDLGGLQ